MYLRQLIRRRGIVIDQNLAGDIDGYSPWIHNELLAIMEEHNAVFFMQIH